jgi:hypothetical protein
VSDLLNRLAEAFGSDGFAVAEEPTTITLQGDVTIDLATGAVTQDPLPAHKVDVIERAIADAQADPVGARRRWQIKKPETVVITFLNGDPGLLIEDDPIEEDEPEPRRP